MAHPPYLDKSLCRTLSWCPRMTITSLTIYSGLYSSSATKWNNINLCPWLYWQFKILSNILCPEGNGKFVIFALLKSIRFARQSKMSICDENLWFLVCKITAVSLVNFFALALASAAHLLSLTFLRPWACLFQHSEK
jgi:hypothetical protein